MPDDLAEFLQQAAQFLDAGHLPQAEASLRRVLAIDPNNATALNLLGKVALRSGYPQTGLKLLHHAAAGLPRQPEFLFDLGKALLQANRLEEAEIAFRRLAVLAPDNVGTLIGLGVALVRREKFAEAVPLLEQGLAMQPENMSGGMALGWALKGLNQPDAACRQFERALSFHPDFPDANYAFGMSLMAVGEVNRGLPYLQKAQQHPDAPLPWQVGYAGALLQAARGDEAQELLERILQQHPNEAEAHGFLALRLLMRGQWERGWREYEWRWRCPSFPRPPQTFKEPLWNGEDPRGMRILLWTEQGSGDTIQFARYIPLLIERGALVSVAVGVELAELMRQIRGIAGVAKTGDFLPSFDAHLPFLSLPAVFHTTPQSVPNRVPYLHAKAEDIAAWGQRLSADGAAGVRVGVAWAGSTTHAGDRYRSIDPMKFRALAQVPGVVLYSLQVGGRFPRPADLPLIDHTSHLRHFADTAALLHHLDLVITVDTAVCHLAGAMAKPVWTLLPAAPDWRWMLDRTDTPWYPTMRLFRQSRLGQWDDPLQRVTEELRQFVAWQSSRTQSRSPA